MRIFFSFLVFIFVNSNSYVLHALTPIVGTPLNAQLSTSMGCTTPDSLQLLSLYNATGGAGWISKWDLTKPVSTWYGVTMTAEGCNVAALNLDNNNLIGKLPKLALPNIVHLSVSRNLLTDTIPNFNTPSLKFLDVSQNQLFGNVPDFLVFKPDTLSIENNNFVFGDIVGKSWLNAKIIIYAPQAKIPIGVRNDSLFVTTGAADKDQQFNWFKDNVYLGTFTHSTFKPTISGMYYCLLTHNTLTIQNNIDKDLVLQSQDYTIRISNGKRIIPLDLPNCLEDDFNQLEALYDSTNGTHWNNSTNWFTADMGKWFGVRLTASGCDVAQVNVPNNNLVGTITNYNLPNLFAFNANHNKLAGSIPNFRLAPFLNSLNVSNNKFTGSLPSFDNVVRLVNLNISNNQLSGVLPDVSALINLETCNLDSNRLSGSIKNLTQLGSLKDLRVIQNSFLGDVPEFVSQDVQYLALDKNKFVFSDFLGKDWVKNCQLSINNSRNLTICQLSYAPQSNIAISTVGDSLSVSTGSPDAEQVFNWYRNGVLFVTTPISKYKPTAPGTYYCAVSHKTLTVTTDPTDSKRNLVLKSDSFMVKSSQGGRALPISLSTCLVNAFNQLEKLYDATAGNNWTNNKNWFTDAHLNNWSGVVLTADSCDVAQINLSNNNLTGNLPNLNLPNLRALNLEGNALSGNLPVFDSLPLLVDINIANNQLSGSIPAFSKSQNLVSIWLSKNQLSGSIPNFDLPVLKTLQLTSNALTGTLPDFKLDSLRTLTVDSNKLSGNLPPLARTPNLITIQVSANQLSGSIPNFANNPQLTTINVSNNNFIFGDLLNYQLAIVNYQLTYAPQAKIAITLNSDGMLSVSTGASDADQIFKWFKDGVLIATTQSSKLSAQSSGLYSCQITHNTITIPANPNRNLILVSTDTAIRVSNGGRIFPKGLRVCLEDDFNQLEALYDSTTGKNWTNNTNWLTDPSLTNWYGVQLTADSCDVAQINLSNNNLIGSIPSFTNYYQLTIINLSTNQLSGSIPDFAQSAKLTTINLSHNNLSGTVPNFNLPNLTELRLSFNQLTGNFPNYSHLPLITTLDLSNNQLAGNLNSITASSLQIFDASHNKLSGSIPSLVSSNQLSSLILSNNKFTGSIPDFANNTQLLTINLNNNQLSGNIPNFNQNPKLIALNLAFNVLSGSIPNFNSNTQLIGITLNNNQLSGNVPNYSHLPLIITLDLSNNQLAGNVNNFTNNPQLSTLNVSNNKFIFGDLFAFYANRLTINNLTYAPQAKIAITLNSSDGMLSVSTGAPDADQQFKWFFIAPNSTAPTLVALTNSSKYKPTATGTYFCQATHNILSISTNANRNLILASENYNVGVSNGGRILPAGLKTCLVEAFNQLEALYDSTDGTHWTDKINWFTNRDLSTWSDVKLTADGCDVSELNVSGNNLSGKLPNINLPKLFAFNASHNKLTGTIPSLINNYQLTIINLSNNQLSGTIPILNLPLLSTLDVSNNALSGNIPDVVLPKLNYFDASFNQLSGSISNFTNSTAIVDFHIANNQFVFGDMVGKQWLGFSNVIYAPQATIPLTLNSDGMLSVSTGASDADQTFKWYNNGVLVSTVLNSSKYKPQMSGIWNCQITHNTITIPANPDRNLILVSSKIMLRVSNGGRIIPSGLSVCLEDDFNQLEALYDSTNGTHWRSNTNWFTATDLSTWFGITVTTDACDVAEIKLSNNNLSGILANINLPNLINLDLSNNKLLGAIPSLNLGAIKNLNLNTNQLAGGVPMLNIPNIVTLDLGSNQLTGTIPAALTYPKLLNLYLNNNQLTGSIPNLNIPTLTSLQLSNNQLSGTIPNFVFPNLTNLQLNNNQLSGTIPNFVFPNLTNLYLYQNKLSGAIPNFVFPKLLNLLLNNNQLSGAIPNFAQSAQLSALSVDNNAFIFGDMLGKPWLNVSNLRYAFQAKIPLVFNNGVFSVTTGAVDADQTFNWFNNGVLVATTHNATFKPTTSGTYSCQITHKTLTVPTDYFKNFVLQSTDSAVRISNGGRVIPNALPNCAVEAYNQLEALYDSTGGTYWTNNTNWLSSGDMTTWYGVSLTPDSCDVNILSLGSNNLVGRLPNSVLNKLVVLDVSGNNLSSGIPNYSLPSLIVLNLGNNIFSGALPNFNCPALKGLLASNNQLSGSIPNFSMPNLKIIDVSFNKLTGVIPNFNLRFLTDLIFQSNQLTGSIPNFSLRFLKTIDVRDNLLSGDIPSLSSLPSLAVMYLQNNGFIFGDMVGKPWLKTPTLAYNPQANIPLLLDARTSALKVFTGAADADQIFRWYVDGVLVATTSNSTYTPTSTGVFSCQITHNALTIPTDNSKNLILKTGGVAIRISKGGRIFPTGLALCLEDDFNQLEALYDSTGGANWTKKTNWFTSADLKTWYGVSLTADGCDVAKIFLGSNNLVDLKGRLPNINLPLLVNLDVSSNQLSGTLPDVGQCAQLSTLNVSGNIFSGLIPDFKLPKLMALDVSANQLSGSVPNFALSIQLSTINIANNQFIFGDLLQFYANQSANNLTYAPQATIPLTLNSDGMLSVFTGAPDADQTFRWFKDGVLVATTQNSKFKPLSSGVYTCQITHRILTVTTSGAKNLVLQSTAIDLRISNGGRIFPTGLARCLEDDYNQLEALYDSTDGTHWIKKTNWLTSADLSTWYGVALTTNTACDVSSVNLSQNNLVGRIPDLILPYLASLDVGYNKLSSVIPDFIAAQNLVSLKLNNNAFTSAIPNFSLPHLQIIDVSFNLLLGNIPDFAACSALSAIRLNNNNLSGAIPNFNLSNLSVLDVSFNQLGGNVPLLIVNYQLSIVNLNNNGFIFGDLLNYQLPIVNLKLSYAPQAKIPTTLGTDGILSVNTGTPDVDQLFKWFKNGVEIPNTNSSKLKPQSAGTYYCQATHHILTIASDAKKNLVLQSQDVLIRFSPGGRLLPIGLPTCLEYNFSQLETLYDSTAGKTWTNSTNWFTSGDMSKWYGISLTPDGCDINQINLSNNNLKGSMTNYVFLMPNLKVLDLSKNNLVGQIPSLINNYQLSIINFSSNHLSGTVPFLNSNPQLTTLDVSNNQLTGTIPLLINNYQLTIINLSNNLLTGTIPDFAQNTKLNTINISSNQLNGTIPSFNLPNLTYLQLNDNTFSNGIPSFSNCPQLQTINLANNQLTNGIPSFNLPNLQTLMLNNNQLSSNIPNFNLPNLTSLNVSANLLSGNVPDFAFSSKLKAISIDNNGFIFGDLVNYQLPIVNLKLTYSPQAKIGINFSKDSLSVSTGEPDSAQQFKWFKDGVLVATTQSHKYAPLQNGIYNCQISHNVLTVTTDINRNLVLQTENFEVSIFAVNFFSFTGKKADTYSLLDWKTSVEVILDSFVVERSNDSTHFVPIGALKGSGNSSTILAYQFKDIAPLIGNNYYRLKAKDNTGKFFYSNIIVIPFFTPTIDLQNDEILTVYPNPAKDYLRIIYQSPTHQLPTINYQISNIAGQVIQFGILKNGDQLNVSHLAQGIYFLRANTKVARFIKS